MSEVEVNVDPEWQKNAIQEIFDKLILPEVQRRQSLGSELQPELIRGFQVVFRGDDTPPCVRINEEVRAICIVRVRDGANVEPGEEYRSADGEIVGYQLTDDEGDFGHFTVVWNGAQWVGGFNFVYNRASARPLVEKAREFHQAADLCFRNDLLGPCVDLLFSAAELAAKAQITCMGQRDWVHQKVAHGRIKAQFNLARRDGNVPEGHSVAFNQLADERAFARYASGVSRLTRDDVGKLITEVGEIVRKAVQRSQG